MSFKKYFAKSTILLKVVKDLDLKNLSHFKLSYLKKNK